MRSNHNLFLQLDLDEEDETNLPNRHFYSSQQQIPSQNTLNSRNLNKFQTKRLIKNCITDEPSSFSLQDIPNSNNHTINSYTQRKRNMALGFGVFQPDEEFQSISHLNQKANLNQAKRGQIQAEDELYDDHKLGPQTKIATQILPQHYYHKNKDGVAVQTNLNQYPIRKNIQNGNPQMDRRIGDRFNIQSNRNVTFMGNNNPRLQKVDEKQDDLKHNVALKKQDGNSSSSQSQSPQQRRINYLRPKQIKDYFQFLCQPIPKKRYLSLTINRGESGLSIFWPQYDLYFSQTRRFLFSAKKKAASTTSNYYMSLNKDDVCSQLSGCYLGKLRSNFGGTIYNIFDEGHAAEVAAELNEETNSKRRSIIATITYGSGQQMTIYLLKEGSSYHSLVGVTDQLQPPLSELYDKTQNQMHIVILASRMPHWDHKSQTYILNFNQRVKVSSTKNFIIEHPKNMREVMMMGKISENQFVLQAGYPLTGRVALGVALSKFDSKLLAD